MTNEQAAERQAKHECLMREMVEALEWAVRQIDSAMIETVAAQQRYDSAVSLLARAKEQQ